MGVRQAWVQWWSETRDPWLDSCVYTAFFEALHFDFGASALVNIGLLCAALIVADAIRACVLNVARLRGLML